MRQHRSHLHLDLSSPEMFTSLAELLSRKAWKHKIKSAFIGLSNERKDGGMEHYISSHSRKHSSAFKSNSLVAIFALVSSLPNLRYLTVDFNDRTLPLDVLLILLKGATRLSHLTMRHVIIQGERGQELHSTLEQYSCKLRYLVLDHCCGTAAVQAFMTKTPRLKQLELVGNSISTMGNLTAQTLVEAVTGAPGNPSVLDSLRLTDVPDLQDEHIASFCQAIINRSKTNDSAAKISMREFHLNSVSLGQVAADAVVSLLEHAHHCAPKLQRVSLHLDTAEWGTTMAPLLASTTCTLTQLQVWVTGEYHKSVVHQTVCLLRSLKTGSSQLEDLHIIQNPDVLYASASGTLPLDGAVQQVLDEVLQTNHTLSRVVLSSETNQGFMDFALPRSIQFKLTQNRVGLAPLMYSSTGVCEDEEKFRQQYVSAIIAGKDELDLVYLALSHHPQLALDALKTTGDVRIISASCVENGPKIEHNSLTSQEEALQKPVSLFTRLKLAPNAKFGRGVEKRFGIQRAWIVPKTSGRNKSQYC